LTELLNDEARAPGDNLCLSYSSNAQVFVTVAKVGSSSFSTADSLVQDSVAFLNALINSEEDIAFLNDEIFAISIMQFVQKVAGPSASIEVTPATQVSVLELLFGIAAKFRIHPNTLTVWFSRAIGDGQEELSFAGATKKDDFPLLYVLLHYIHHEGKIGDFARTGLLYVIESASVSEELETWICESDMATLMASGLGALYSQLPRRLYLSFDDDPPPLLAFADDKYVPVQGAESSSSDQFKSHMKTFLSHLLFWQDVLEHCGSADVKQTLLDHFHVLFLQQLLYPSILESSDSDGGSAIAILTYMHQILDSLDHPDLIHPILHYLLALPPESVKNDNKPVRRQKSMDLLTMSTSLGETRPVNWFTLADLILISLKAPHHQVQMAALRLATVILKKHHKYALNTLVKVSYEFDEESGRTIGAQDKEVEYLLSLVELIGGEDDFDELYEGYLSDIRTLIEAHTCFETLLGRPDANRKFINAEHKPRELYLHGIWQKDALLLRLSGLLDTFYTNDVEVNLILTETILNLGACGYVRLPGWLVVHFSKYLFPSDGKSSNENDEDETSTDLKELQSALDEGLDEEDLLEKRRLKQVKLARRIPTWQPDSLPPLLQSLQYLVTIASSLRSTIPRFDNLLLERKQAFQVSDRLSEAIASKPVIRPSGISTPHMTPQKIQSPTPVRQSTLSSISQRIFSSPRATPPRTDSPRGRQLIGETSTPTKSRFTPSPSKLQIQSSLFGNGSISPSPANFRSQSPKMDQLNIKDVIQGFREPRKRELKKLVHIPPANAGSGSTSSPTLIQSRYKEHPQHDDTSDDNEEDEDEDSNDSDSSHAGTDSETGSGSDESDSESEENQESPSPTRNKGNHPVQARTGLEQQHHTASVGHVLTNMVVLQHFLLELAALIQTRASILEDVKYT
jgi:hypothetical protein